MGEHHHTVNTVDKISGQTLGKQFELLTMEFLQETFPYLQNIRPGKWIYNRFYKQIQCLSRK